MKNKLKSLGRFLLRMLIALVVVMFMIFVRLAYGPVPFDRLGETIAKPFEQAFPGREFVFTGSFIEWSWEDFAFVFSLEKVQIKNADQTPFANFNRLGVNFDWTHLITGNFVPAGVSLEGPILHFEWSAKRFGEVVEQALLNPDEELPEPEEETPPVVEIMQTMLKGEGENSPLKSLREIRINDAVVTLTEKDLGVIWEIPRGDLIVRRAEAGLSLSADINFLSRKELIQIRMESVKTGDGMQKTTLSLEGLNIAMLAREVSLGPLFQTIDMPLYGTFTIFQNETGGINLLGFDFGGGPGTIFYERLNTEPSRFEDVVFKGTLNTADNLIALETLRLVIDGDIITGDGFVEFTTEDRAPALRMVLQSDRLKVDSFLQLWPTAKRSGGRDWIDENVENGQMANVRAELAFTPETWGQKPLPNEAMHITFDLVGGDVHFLRPMPPIQNPRGRMMIEGNEAQGVLTEGTVDNFQFRDLAFNIENLTQSKAQMGYANFNIAGDIQELMRFVDQEPLYVFIKQGLDPADYFGNAELNVALQVPLYTGAPPEALDYTIEGRVKEVAVPEMMAGGGVSEGDMQVTITPLGLVSQGYALLKGVPFEFYWTQDFIKENPDDFSTRLELNGYLTDKNFHVFGLPEDLTMDGTARVYMSLRGRDGDLKFGQGSADFFKANINAKKMDWFKRANRRADARFELEWTDTELLLNNVEITSPELTIKAGFVFDKFTGLMKRADVPVYLTPGNDLNVTARQRQDGVLDVTIHAKRANAAPYLADMFEETEGESFAPNMRLTMNAADAFAMNEVVYKNVSLEADKRAEYWIEANIIGGMDEGGAFQIVLTNDGNGRHLNVESDNAGRFALGADIFRNATGGRMTLTADMNVYREPLYSKGVLSADGFRMVKSSVLIQALSEEEQSGLDEMIKEEGILFSRLEIPFELKDEIFDISDASARGDQFGFTMEGEVDQDFYRMNLNGTVVPAYSLNTFISRIPIIGTIIAGGAGEGLFALNYRITGTREDPNVDFDPLSVVAPGIFRKILGSQTKGRLESEPSLRDQPVEEEETPANPEAPQEGDDGGGLFQF